MIRKTLVSFGISLMLCGTAAAFDGDVLNQKMYDLSHKIGRTLLVINVNERFGEESSVDALVGKGDKVRREVEAIVGTIDSVEEFEKARQISAEYAEGSAAERHAAQILEKSLRQRALFVEANKGPGAPGLSFLETELQLDPIGLPQFLKPDEFIAVDVPSAEGVVYIQDKKWGERKELFQNTLKRHDCDVLSDYLWKKGDDVHNFYISCKQFVTEELVHHFGGAMGNVFEVEMELKTGSWLLGKKLEISVPADHQASEKSGLGWYQAVVEQKPFKWLNDNKLADLSKLGKQVEIAGTNSLLLKNARAKIWIKPQGGERRNAIYFIEKKYGDVQLKEGK